MSGCCSGSGCELEGLRTRQSSTLKIVLLLNALMFAVELTAGLLAGSTALLADSLDMLGDALVYGFSLYVVARSLRWKAAAALIKGLVMAAFGLFVVAQALYRATVPIPPQAETMGTVGLLALAVNGLCFALLWRHRGEDINMRSVWLCSRNDIAANIAVLGAAAAVAWSGSRWPDIVVGLLIASLFLHSAYSVLKDAISQLRAPSLPAVPMLPQGIAVQFEPTTDIEVQRKDATRVH
jgi:cation diffusion facilitator family transporter